MYDAANRLQEDIAYAYTFDARGNLTQKVDKTTGERQVYAYNGDNRLIRFERYPSGSTSPDTTATYAYDPFGRRIQKTVNGQATHFQWDGASLIAEYDASGNATKRYHYAIGYAPVQVEDAHGVYQVHAGHLNTPWYLTDASRQIVWQANYAPYGEAVTDEDPDGNAQAVTFNVRFPGQYFDTETGLHYNYFRDYDPAIGRYLESDPIGLAGGVNTYTYVVNNPINFIDPNGLRGMAPIRPPGTPGYRRDLHEAFENLNDPRPYWRPDIDNPGYGCQCPTMSARDLMNESADYDNGENSCRPKRPRHFDTPSMCGCE